MKYAKVDLHLHLDGSLNMPWAWETARKRGVVAPDCTFEEYYHIMHRTEFKNREERMTRFDFPIAIMQTREDLAASIYHLIETLAEKELYYAEIRFAPQQHMLQGLSQKEVVEAVLSGKEQAEKDFPGIKTGVINCMMHKGADAHTNWEANLETIRVTKEFLGKGVVALDLAGYENNGDFNLYAPLFEIAKEQGIPYTIHAGEMGDGSHVPMAIAMGASRIGHGINCVLAPEWLAEAGRDISSQLTTQFYSDGIHIELTPSYQLGVMENFRVVYNTALANERLGAFSSDYVKCLRNACIFMASYVWPNYTWECFNDTFRQTRNVLLRNIRNYYAMFPDEPVLKYLGSDRKEGSAPAQTLSSFPEGGYYMLRNGWDESSTMMILKNNYNPVNKWHCQMDNGTVALWSKGRNFLPDAVPPYV